MTFADLPAALAAVCPIRGLDGNPSRRETWVILFADGVTGAQKVAAQAILDACPVDPIPTSGPTPLELAVARIAALEARPEEVAHFSAVARLPNVAVGATFTVTLTGLVPARAGDTLRAGETVEVRVVGDLPAGVAWKGPQSVPADGNVACTFTAALALSGATPITFAITALR